MSKVSFNIGDTAEETRAEDMREKKDSGSSEDEGANRAASDTTAQEKSKPRLAPLVPGDKQEKRSAEDEPAQPPQSPTSPKTSLVGDRKKLKRRYIHCDDCGADIPLEDWPNHRDRLREVVIKERLSHFQKQIVSLFVDLFMWLLVNVFFREVAVCGLENVPREGPVVFYGNHQNQFIDAMMIRAHCGRPVRFIIAEKSMHRPVIGHLARLMDAVPVVRPQDVTSTVGEGKLVKMERNRITGEGTLFTSVLKRGDVISWTVPGKKERCSGQVLNVESDTQLVLTLPVADEDIIAEPTAYKYSQRIDHSEMYAAVYDTLSRGECIAIFPEGGSHDRTSLLPLKAGVALFSLGAAERGIYPKIIPCGLTYFYGHKFRSRAHIEFGEPVMPTEEMVESFRTGTHKREATGELLRVLDTALRNVTINVPDWATLNFLHSFRRLYQPPAVRLHTRDYLQLARRLGLIIEEHGPELAEFRSRVENYNDYCSALLVRDSQAATLENLEDASIRLLIRRCMLLLVMGIVLMPFFFIATPIGLITHFAAEAHAKTALSASSVKVVGADVKGSYKLVVGFVVVPLVMNGVSFIVFLLSDWRTALTIFFSLPMAMYVSLLILQEFILELRAALPLLMSIFSKHKQFRKLYERRQKLVEMAKEYVKTFDPGLEEELSQLSTEKEDYRQPSLFSLRHSSRKPISKRI